MLNSRQKKQYLVLVIFAIGWRLIGGQLWYDLENILWKLLNDTIFGRGIFSMLLGNLFPRFMELFGFYILAIGSTCIAICSGEKQKKFLYLLSLALIALWIAVPFFKYLTIKDMSYWRPNMARNNFVPFHGKFINFIACVLFYHATNGDGWLNIQLFMPLGILAAGCHKKWLYAGIAVGAGILIEIMQFCTSIGHFDVNDIIYRVTGTLIGIGIGILVLRRKNRSIEEKDVC